MYSFFNVYTDGSFSNITRKASWAFVVLDDKNNVIYKNKGVLEGEINTMRQVGGEITAVMEAVAFCATRGVKCKIFFDYLGIKSWTNGYWKAKNVWTKKYQQFINLNKNTIISFVKVKAHSGNKFNDLVDQLAKQV